MSNINDAQATGFVLALSLLELCVRRPYARNATATPKGRTSESTLFHLPGHIYGSVDSCIPKALHSAESWGLGQSQFSGRPFCEGSGQYLSSMVFPIQQFLLTRSSQSRVTIVTPSYKAFRSQSIIIFLHPSSSFSFAAKEYRLHDSSSNSTKE